ncbi:MAG: DUF5666 domain-containing protein [bacterium]|nr:DUF5666 domain-containing protein [bacterium]
MMTTIQRIAVSGATMGLSLGLAFSAAATSIQPPSTQGSLSINPRGSVQLRGTVTKVDAAAKTIGVKVWGTEWTVKVGDATKFQPLGWRREPMTLADVAVGHSVSVTGIADATIALTVTAKRITNHSFRPKPIVGYVGKITVLTPPDAFTLQVQRGGQLTVKTTADTKFWLGETAKAYADLAVGAEVKVRGIHDAAVNTLTAAEVRLTPEKPVRSEKAKEKKQE